jgi:hypothetical protein
MSTDVLVVSGGAKNMAVVSHWAVVGGRSYILNVGRILIKNTALHPRRL